MRATKIVATLGPSTDSEAVMRSLFEAGVDVFRLNASHGTQDDHARRIKMVRELSGEFKTESRNSSRLARPEIRLGTFKNGPCMLRDDAVFTITTEVEGTGRSPSRAIRNLRAM